MSRKAKPPRLFPWPCSTCGAATVVPRAGEFTAKVKHDGVVHELHLQKLRIPRCSICGEETITTAIDEKINDALRAKLRLLSPRQIQKEIKQLGVKQQDLAARLGVTPETISRWVHGALIQSRAMDNLLRVYFAFPVVRKALGDKGQGGKKQRMSTAKVG